jgi:UDP-glucose 4-epimerase
MNILVTGGAGYIGSHVVKQLLEHTDHDVTIIDNLSTGHRSTLDTLEQIARESGRGDLRFYHADLADFAAIEKIFLSERFDALIHFAASIVVPESVENPLKYYMNNTVNTTNLVRLCNEYGLGKMIFSSTAAVYGEPDLSSLGTQQSSFKIDESYPTAPINPYGMSKLMSERIIRDAAAANPDFDYVILRYFNVAGADINNEEHPTPNTQHPTSRPRIGQSFPNATHLIKVAAQTALGKRPKMAIYGEDYDTPDGTCVRDYIHVDDLASAHLKALEYLASETQHPAPSTQPNIFNVGYGHGFSVREVIDTVREVSGVDFPVDTEPRRAGDPALLISDNTRARTVLGWEPRHDDLSLICRTALEWEKNL